MLLQNLLAETKQKYRFELLNDNGAIDPHNLTRIDQFVAAGVDYAVVSESDYAPLFAAVVSVALSNNQSFEAAKQFHSELFSKGPARAGWAGSGDRMTRRRMLDPSDHRSGGLL